LGKTRQEQLIGTKIDDKPAHQKHFLFKTFLKLHKNLLLPRIA